MSLLLPPSLTFNRGSVLLLSSCSMRVDNQLWVHHRPQLDWSVILNLNNAILLKIDFKLHSSFLFCSFYFIFQSYIQPVSMSFPHSHCPDGWFPVICNVFRCKTNQNIWNGEKNPSCKQCGMVSFTPNHILAWQMGGTDSKIRFLRKLSNEWKSTVNYQALLRG